MRRYRDKLGSFVGWLEGTTLSDFTVQLAPEYTSYLKCAPKLAIHPLYNRNCAHMSSAHV